MPHRIVSLVLKGLLLNQVQPSLVTSVVIDSDPLDDAEGAFEQDTVPERDIAGEDLGLGPSEERPERNDDWSTAGDCICRHHGTSRQTLYVFPESLFPIP